MTQDTEDVVALRHELALISLEYAAKGLEREAGRVMRAINLIERQETDRQSLSDRIDELRSDCKFLLACIDQSNEAGAPVDESDPEDIATIDQIRAALHQEGIANAK